MKNADVKHRAAPVVLRGMDTPWGIADYAKTLCEGIGVVSTPSHGGIKLSPERNLRVPAPLRAENGWYEEDCQWAVPFYFFAEELRAAGARGVDQAESTLKNWFHKEFTAATGIAVKPEESSGLREEIFYAEHFNDWLTIAAWGDWQPGVPKGMVGVCAILGGRSRTALLKDRSPERWFLVPEAEYATRCSNAGGSFVIDPARHQEVPCFTQL